MKVLLVCLVLVAVSGALPVRVKRGHEHHHEHATSYQNFNLESYHPVPVYAKHEYKEYDHHSSADVLSHHEGLGEHESHGQGHGQGLGQGLGHGSSEGYVSLGHDGGLEGYQRASYAAEGDDHSGLLAHHQGAVAEAEEGEEKAYEGHEAY